MTLLALVTGFAFAQQQVSAVRPVLWLDLQGNVAVGGKAFEPNITAGATSLDTPMGTVYSFTGDHGGMVFPDLQELKLGDSMTISTWLFLRSYVVHGSNAQILFRGDNRGGLDPYSLRIEKDKTLTFQIQNDQNASAKVKATVPLGHWFHVVASFNSKNGEMAMWLNGEPASHTFTHLRPFTLLSPVDAPGVSIGNVQHNGPDNEPLNGMVGDLRLYPGALTPVEAGFVPRVGD